MVLDQRKFYANSSNLIHPLLLTNDMDILARLERSQPPGRTGNKLEQAIRVRVSTGHPTEENV